MDFVGQKHYEYTATILYLIEGFVCFVIGFALKDFEMMIKIFFAGASMGSTQSASNLSCVCQISSTPTSSETIL